MSSEFNPDVLLIARESRGKTQAAIAEALGVKQGFISKVENGLQSLTPDQVEEVGKFLEYPAALFYEEGPVREGRSGCLFHRKRKTLPVKILDLLDGRMAVRLINARHMLQGIEIDAERGFHMLDPEEYGSPEEVAKALRTSWRIADGPIHNLVALIESAGGIIVMSSFGTQKLYGMSQWTTQDHPLFFLNSDISMEDLRWTLAHELGHLVMHATPTTGDMEEEADAFAGEFLTPRRLLAPHLRGLDFSRLPPLKLHWRISMKALIKRAEVIEAISRADAIRLYKQYSALRWHNAEPYPLPQERPTLLRRAADVHFDEHKYTRRELAEAVRLNENELMSELLGERARGKGRLSIVPG
jgi:Zn-dependent peptidase ImmA (M78 family)